MHQFTMRCINRVNTDQAPDHVVVGFSPGDQSTVGTFQLVLPEEEYAKFKPGKTYTFTAEEQPDALAAAEPITPQE